MIESLPNSTDRQIDTRELQARLQELEETLRAIRTGEIDALVVNSPAGDRVFTLQGAEHPYRVLVESMNEGAVTISKDGAILYANRRFSEMLRCPLEKLIGAFLPGFVTGIPQIQIQRLLVDSAESPHKVECQMNTGRGEAVPVYLSLSPLSGSDFEGISVIATDLTEQKRKELELADLNVTLASEIAQKNRAEKALLAEEESLRQLSGRLLQLQDEERRRIARDLHDSTGQQVVGLTLALNLVQQDANDLGPRGRQSLAHASEIASQIASDIRTLSYLLHPPLLEEVGLVAAARWYVDGFIRRSNIKVDLEIPAQLPRMKHDLEITVFRILQESLTNVHRHSGSSTATVKILSENGTLKLVVRDKGTNGSQVASMAEKPVEMLGVGIRGMRERVRQLGGSLELQSTSEGTQVCATLPIQYVEPALDDITTSQTA